MKLSIELIPECLWGLNLRKQLSRDQWDEIRFKAYAEAGDKCSICNAESKLQCHEIWEWDDINHIQRLKGFIALCRDCHMIKHIGFAGIQASKGLLDFDKLIDHFCKVNGVAQQDFDKHKEASFDLWYKRNEFGWTLDLDKWADLVNKK